MSTTTEKRRSLHIPSSSSTNGPRPLQLAAGSPITGSSGTPPHSSSSSCASPVPPFSSRPHTPSSASVLEALEGRLDSPSPLSPFSSTGKKGRRQSSISYFSSNRPNDRDHESLRSPLSARGG